MRFAATSSEFLHFYEAAVRMALFALWRMLHSSISHLWADRLEERVHYAPLFFIQHIFIKPLLKARPFVHLILSSPDIQRLCSCNCLFSSPTLMIPSLCVGGLPLASKHAVISSQKELPLHPVCI